MLVRHAFMRQLMRDGGDNAGLGIGPPQNRNLRPLPQPQFLPIRRHQQTCGKTPSIREPQAHPVRAGDALR